MRNPFVAGVGGVLSADVAVPEHERELSFYSRILTTGHAPLWCDDLTNNRGMPVLGLGERVPEYATLPLQWMPHIQVLDVGASVARALELGGHEFMNGQDEDGQCQWAVLADPAGAAFGLIPVVGDASAAMVEPETVGRIASLTLVVPNVPSACEFYERVVGWSAVSTDVDGEFELRRSDGGASAAICFAGGDHEGVPPVWILGLPVDDLNESIRLVRESGGEIVKGSTETGRAVIRDPVGVVAGLQANR